MSDPRRLLVGLAIAVLAAGAAVIAVVSGGDREEPPALVAGTSEAEQTERPSIDADQVLAELREHADHAAEADDVHETREVAGDPTEEIDARHQEVATFEAERRNAEPVARRFFDAFALYELGEGSGAVERLIAQTTTPRFRRELLASRPPRVPDGIAAPPLARLVGLDFVPGRTRGAELLALEFVATIDRNGERTPLAIALRRAQGGWLVDPLGR